MDYLTGVTIAERNPNQRLGPASITKVMTVYVAANALASGLIALDDEVLVSEKAWRMGGSRMFVEVGTRVSVDQLLDGIIVQSGNDASVALAEHVSGSEEVFAALMNEQARKLGMKDSHFSNATGWPDPETYSTARDLAVLAAALIREHPQIYQRFARREFAYNGIKQPNRNRLLYHDSGVDGIKTGHTDEAGYCLLSSSIQEGSRMIAAVMGTDSDAVRTEASRALLSFGHRFFESRKLYASTDVVIRPRILGASENEFPVGVARDLMLTIPRGKFNAIKANAKLSEPLWAPVHAGQVVGSLAVTLDGEPLAEQPLIALADVEEGSFISRLYDHVMLWFE